MENGKGVDREIVFRPRELGLAPHTRTRHTYSSQDKNLCEVEQVLKGLLISPNYRASEGMKGGRGYECRYSANSNSRGRRPSGRTARHRGFARYSAGYHFSGRSFQRSRGYSAIPGAP